METKELCNLQERNRPYDNVNIGYHIPVNSHRNMLIPVIRGLLPEPTASSSCRDYRDCIKPPSEIVRKFWGSCNKLESFIWSIGLKPLRDDTLLIRDLLQNVAAGIVYSLISSNFRYLFRASTLVYT